MVTARAFQLEEAVYRSGMPKNIVFGAVVPGSSHVTWVLRFLDELAQRGHNVTFITVDENLKYGKAYPRLNTVSIGPAIFRSDKALSAMDSHPDILDLMPVFFQLIVPSWEPAYLGILEQIEKQKVDIVICDHFSEGCMDASRKKNLPLAVTSTLAMYPDAVKEYINDNIATISELTTQHQSISKRLYNKFIMPLRLFPKIKTDLGRLNDIKRHHGIPSTEPTTHALKIVSTVFGLEAPRPVGPLVELVGPVFSTEYQGLDETFATYLSQHTNVVYVAFGQHASPSEQDVTRVLTALIHQYEKGHIDGIIWSSGNARKEKFPATLTSAYSGKTYDLAALFDPSNKQKKDSLGGDLFVTRWSPQMAVLLHPSVSVFVSHGGANSLIEALHAQKRLIFYPFFGDQPGIARHLSGSGLSEYFDHLTALEEIDARVEKVVRDVDGSYQQTVQRYQALVQIHSKAAPSRAADLIEEAAYTAQGARLAHREDVGNSMSFIKRYNVDLYAIVLVVVGSLVTVVAWGALRLARRAYMGARVYQKTKTL